MTFIPLGYVAAIGQLFPHVDPNTQGINAIPYLITDLIDLALFVAGALSIIFLIIGSLRLATSTGNPASVASARKTIQYAILGLVLSLLAVAIVTVVNPVFTNPSSQSTGILSK